MSRVSIQQHVWTLNLEQKLSSEKTQENRKNIKKEKKGLRKYDIAYVSLCFTVNTVGDEKSCLLNPDCLYSLS